MNRCFAFVNSAKLQSELYIEGKPYAFVIGERVYAADEGGFAKEVEAFLQKLFEVRGEEYGEAGGQYAYACSANYVSEPVFVVVNPSEAYRGCEGVGCNAVKG